MPPITPAPRLQSPTIDPYQAPKPFGYQPTKPGTFDLAAPAAAPTAPFLGSPAQAKAFASLAAPAQTAAFIAPTPGALSQAGQFRIDQGQKAIERGAAARGTLLTGGLQARLAEHGQGVASEEYDKDYQRALATYETNRGTNAQNFNQTAQTYGANRDTAAMNTGQERDAYTDLIRGYEVNRDTAAQNAQQQRATFADALTGVRANADLTLAGNAQELTAATAGYDRNAAAGRTVYEDAAADAMRRTNVDNVNNAGVYQTQMLEYARQQEEARRMQDTFLREEEQAQQMRDSRAQDEARMAQYMAQQRQAEAERQRAEMERLARENAIRQREGAARQNAVTNAIPFTLADPLAAPIRRQPRA